MIVANENENTEVKQPEPKTFNVINQASSWPAWASLVVSALVTLTLAYSQYKTVVVPPGPQPPAPIVVPVVEPVKPTLIDSTARRNGVRDDSIKAPLVELTKIGNGTYTLTFEPDGKQAVVWTVVVTGGDKPAPVPSPKPDEPLPQPPPVDPNTKVTAVTYVFEKDQGGVPNYVSTALNKINRESKFAIVASIFEDDSKNGNIEVPAQYKAAYEAAQKEGLPAVVVTAGSKVLRSIKAPKTEAEIVEAAK
jgi:hypothetical protein